MTKLFQILVPDNTLVSRVISCENQVNELFVIERADKGFVANFAKELTRPALYILINREKNQLYIGETDDSYKRLKNHEVKDFWTEAIVFHSTNNTLSATEVKWLEAKTYETISNLGYYDLSENKQKPQYPTLKKNQIYTLEPIFEDEKNYICAAGFDIFLKQKINLHEDDNIAMDSISNNYTNNKSAYISSRPSINTYFNCLRGKIIKNVLIDLNLSDDIFDISSIDKLKEIRKIVSEREINTSSHNRNSCAISKLITYIENGYSYKEFMHDALLAKKNKTYGK